jgi:MoaA/NifB/PqqE/SkfB family radical SAM enzyme
MTLPRLVLVVRVTERCNMGCAFCAYDRRLDRSRAGIDEGELRRFGALVARWAAARGRPVLVSWLGGEPLLYPPLEALSADLRALGCDLAITTNGLGLASPRWRAFAIDALAELTVSLDGLAAWNDRVRDHQGGHALVMDAIRAIAAAKRRRGSGPILRVNTILMRQSVADFPAFCADLAEAGIEEITFNQLGGNDRPEFHPDHRLLPDQVDAFAAALPALRHRFAARGLVIRGGDAYLARLRASAHGVAIPIDDCGPGRTFWFLDERGRLAPCSFTPDGYGIPIVSLRDEVDLDALPARWDELGSTQRLRACLDCHSTQVFDKFVPRELR